MAKGTRGRRASRQCRTTPYSFLLHNKTAGMQKKNCSKAFKDWEDVTCSVCMECPHNAVLLLCSSHEKGCRPYMCGTSSRYSNCLDQYKKAYTKVFSSDYEPIHDSLHGHAVAPLSHRPLENCDTSELACPLCRGQVKGWTVVQAARDYLNAKTRSCMHNNCLFLGTYKELRKHVKVEHPTAKPHEVDPAHEQKWKRLEYEREREDVVSTIRSSMPGAMFFGDYVIEQSHYDSESDDEDEDSFDAADTMRQNGGMEVGVDRNLMSMFLFLQAFGSSSAGSHRGIRRNDRGSSSNTNAMRSNRVNTIITFDSADEESEEDEENNNDASLDSRVHRQGRVVLGRSGRRSRASGDGSE